MIKNMISKVFNEEFCKNREMIKNCVLTKDSIKALKKMYKSAKRPTEFGIVLAYSFGMPGCNKLRLKCVKSISNFNRDSPTLKHELFDVKFLFSQIETYCGSFGANIYNSDNWAKQAKDVDNEYIIHNFIEEIKECDANNYTNVFEHYLRLFFSKLTIDVAAQMGVSAEELTRSSIARIQSIRPLN